MHNSFEHILLSDPDDRAYYGKHKDQLGLEYSEFARLRKGRYEDLGPERVLLHGRIFEATSAYWLLHSLDEIFVRDVYRFTPASDAPLIIDCGANWGLSVLHFKMRHPRATIIAFEPDRELFAVLKGNVDRFALTDVELVNKAVWMRNETLSFSSEGALGGALLAVSGDVAGTDEDEAQGSLPGSPVAEEVAVRVSRAPKDAKRIVLEAVQQNPAEWEAITKAGMHALRNSWDGNVNVYDGTYRTTRIDVQAVRLRDLLVTYQKIDLLKIDIEGAECAVIADCSDELRRVDHLFVEYHSRPAEEQQLDAMLRSLREAGFRYHIKEAAATYAHPFERTNDVRFDQQLNIYCYRTTAA